MAQEPQQLPAVHEAWLPREHALHRPRHGGRQLTALICALVFFTTPTLMWVFGARPAEIENRHLTGFPSLAGGWAFFTTLPTWATDQLTFRGAAIQAADGISEAIFGESAPHDQTGANNSGPLQGGPPGATGQTNDSTDGSGPVDQAGYRAVIEGRDGWMYFGGDAEAKCAPAHDLAVTLARIKEIRDIVTASGRKFIWVVPPDKSTMVQQFLPSSYPGKACHDAAEASTWAQLDAAGVVDVRPGIAEAARQVDRPVYPDKDTHWGDEGGLVMAAAVANAAEPGVTQTWKFGPTGSYTVAADLPPLIGKRGDKTNVIYNLMPDGVTDRAGKIAEIDRPVVSTGPTIAGMVGKKTLVYGDSFTQASSRYLSGAFSNLTMLAFSTTKTTQDEAIGQWANADVVVLETVERNVSGGYLPFYDDAFINALRTKLAAHPVK